MKCTSCNTDLISEEKFTQFSCPSCMDSNIVRCLKCRRKNSAYICKCGFEGP